MKVKTRMTPEQEALLLSQVNFDDILSATLYNDGMVVYSTGEEMVWPAEFQVDPLAPLKEVRQVTALRASAFHVIFSRLMQNHTREIVLVGTEGALIWRPGAQKGWNGRVCLQVKQVASETGSGGRSLQVKAGPCLKFEYEYDSDVSLEGEVERWRASCAKNGWEFEVQQPEIMPGCHLQFRERRCKVVAGVRQSAPLLPVVRITPAEFLTYLHVLQGSDPETWASPTSTSGFARANKARLTLFHDVLTPLVDFYSACDREPDAVQVRELVTTSANYPLGRLVRALLPFDRAHCVHREKFHPEAPQGQLWVRENEWQKLQVKPNYGGREQVKATVSPKYTEAQSYLTPEDAEFVLFMTSIPAAPAWWLIMDGEADAEPHGGETNAQA